MRCSADIDTLSFFVLAQFHAFCQRESGGTFPPVGLLRYKRQVEGKLCEYESDEFGNPNNLFDST